MAWPHPALLDVAAGRPWPGGVPVGEVLHDADRHRLTGQLWAAVRDLPDVGTDTERAHLRDTWLTQRLVSRRLLAVLRDVVARAADVDIDLATIKGPVAEHRWYGEAGLRPSVDVDVVLPGHQRHRAGELLRLLCPQHPLVDHLQRLVDARLLQSVTFPAPGTRVAVDLHVDSLKLEGLWSRTGAEVDDGATRYALDDGTRVQVHDADVSLLQHALHLNKDRFRSLRGFVDVARIITDPTLRWDRVHDLADRDGLLVPVTRSIAAVVDLLGLPPSPLPHLRGPRAEAWDAAWPTDVWFRDARELRQRQLLLPLLARGRAVEATGRVVRRMFAPRAQIAYYLGRPELAEGSYAALTWARALTRVSSRGARARR